MYLEKLTISGQKYTIKHHDDGTISEEPPLPESARKRFEKNHKAMVTECKAPGLNTDTSFHAKRGSLVDQLGGDEAWAKFIVKRAREKGAVITDNHTYISQLAREPGDVEAFVPPGEGKGYIKKLAEKRGKSLSGSIEYAAPLKEPEKKVRLAEDLVQSQMWRYRKEGRVDGSVSNAELRKTVIDKHGSKVK